MHVHMLAKSLNHSIFFISSNVARFHVRTTEIAVLGQASKYLKTATIEYYLNEFVNLQKFQMILHLPYSHKFLFM